MTRISIHRDGSFYAAFLTAALAIAVYSQVTVEPTVGAVLVVGGLTGFAAGLAWVVSPLPDRLGAND